MTLVASSVSQLYKLHINIQAQCCLNFELKLCSPFVLEMCLELIHFSKEHNNFYWNSNQQILYVDGQTEARGVLTTEFHLEGA